MIHGCDISFWQDDDATARKVDFNAMRAAGASFVIIKAGQGSWKDEDWQDYYTAAKAAGLPRGLYWFYDSRYSPTSQAALCLSTIGTEAPELGIWGDFEDTYNGPYKGWQNFKIFLSALRVKLPRVGIYTGPYYWKSNCPTGAADLAYFKTFPLWIAHYSAAPLVPAPWTSWILWQYTSSGDGIAYGAESKEIDLDYFNGDMSAFCEYFDLTNISQPPSNGGTMALYEGTGKLSSTPYTRIRKPNADGSLNPDGMTIGQINPGQAFKADARALDNMSREWLHVYEVGGKPIDGWSAAWLLDYTETTPPPPPPPVVVKVPFTLSVDGFKPYSGELEKA